MPDQSPTGEHAARHEVDFLMRRARALRAACSDVHAPQELRSPVITVLMSSSVLHHPGFRVHVPNRHSSRMFLARNELERGNPPGSGQGPSTGAFGGSSGPAGGVSDGPGAPVQYGRHADPPRPSTGPVRSAQADAGGKWLRATAAAWGPVAAGRRGGRSSLRL